VAPNDFAEIAEGPHRFIGDDRRLHAFRHVREAIDVVSRRRLLDQFQVNTSVFE
jgi:hypothetical protein